VTITVNKQPDGPIILATFEEPVDWHTEVPDMFAQIFALRDTFEGCPKYYVIIDVSAVKVGFGEMVSALGEVRAASKKRRPDMPIQLSMVGSGSLIEFAAKAMQQSQYGEYHSPLYTSVEKALEVIHADIAGWSA
jgi:hypothetical protein